MSFAGVVAGTTIDKEVMPVNGSVAHKGRLVDIHTHILPGVDDGAHDWEAAIAMLRVAADDGIVAVVCTPHQHDSGPLINAPGTVAPLLAELQGRAVAEGLPVSIYAGGEVHCTPDTIARWERGDVSLLGDGARYMLLEMPAAEVPVYARQVVFDLVVRGITPIIAHPERNEGIMREPALLAELVEAGALAQLTAASLSRLAGTVVLETAALLVAHNLVHVLASDAHSPHRRPPVISKYADRIASVWGQARAQAMTCALPLAVLQGQPVQVEAPVQFTRQSRREAIMVARALASGGGRSTSGLWKLLRAR